MLTPMRRLAVLLSIAVLALPVTGISQTHIGPGVQTDTRPSGREPVQVESLNPAAEPLNAAGADADRCTTQAELDHALEELKEELKEAMRLERAEEFEAHAEEQMFADVDNEDGQGGPKLLRIYGFFDMTFSKYFFEGVLFHLLTEAYSSSFVITNFSLYFDSQMTETLSALAEVSFTFLPHGKDISLPLFLGENQIPGTEYKRINNTFMDPFTGGYRTLGGVEIVRLHLTYSPHDAFNIRGGRFLTPFGIWNIDHGSPVIIPLRSPYILSNEIVPLGQTGLVVFGTFYPTSTLFLSYAVTLSNGRSATETVYDLDENKAVGVRLKLAYEKPRFSLVLGAYGYYGQASDITKSVHVDPTNMDFYTKVDTFTDFDEWIGSLDFRLQIYGFRLQSEYAHRRVYFSEQKEMDWVGQVIQTNRFSTGDTHYMPSYIGHIAYVLLAYELPLHRWLGQFRITPYLMYEYYDGYDYLKYLPGHAYAAGINLKPSPYIILKLEWSLAIAQEMVGSKENTLQNIAVQMAVAF